MTRMFQAETHRERCLAMLSAWSVDIAGPILGEYREGTNKRANPGWGGEDKFGPGTLQGPIATAEYSFIAGMYLGSHSLIRV